MNNSFALKYNAKIEHWSFYFDYIHAVCKLGLGL